MPQVSTSALPVVVTEEGEALVDPTNAAFADMLGLSTTPSLEMYDLAVIGGGPAGLAAAVYGASEGLKTVLIERTTTGGQAGRSSRIENYLGFPTGVSGAELTTSARRQAERFGAEVITTRKAVGLEADDSGSARTIRFEDGSTIGAQAVILATGVDYRQLRVKGCWEDPDDHACNYVGRGVYYGASVSDASECATRTSTSSAAPTRPGRQRCIMSREAKSVTLLVRGPSLEASMSYYLIQQIEKNDKIKVRTCTEVVRLHRRGRPPHRPGAREQAHRRERDRRLLTHVLFHRRRAAHQVAGRCGGPRRPRLHPHRPRPEGRLRLDAGPPAAPPGNKCAGCVCCR